MDGRLAGRPTARRAGVNLNTDGRMGVAGVAWRDAHGGKRRVVGHGMGLAHHGDATEGGAEGGEGWSSLKMLLGAHVGRVWSRPGGLEDPAWTRQPVSCGGVAVRAAQVQTGGRGAGGAQQGGAHPLRGHPAAAPHVPGRVADGLVVEVQPAGDVRRAVRLPVSRHTHGGVGGHRRGARRDAVEHGHWARQEVDDVVQPLGQAGHFLVQVVHLTGKI